MTIAADIGNNVHLDNGLGKGIEGILSKQTPEEDSISSFSLEDLTEQDKAQITDTINSAFKEQDKKLVDNYFDIIQEYNPKIHMGKEKKGVAITYKIDGINYLCKFAIKKEEQGNGFGEKLFKYLVQKEEKFAFRVCEKNLEANNFYLNQLMNYKPKSINGFVVLQEGFQKGYLKAANFPKTIKPTIEVKKWQNKK